VICVKPARAVELEPKQFRMIGSGAVAKTFRILEPELNSKILDAEAGGIFSVLLLFD